MMLQLLPVMSLLPSLYQVPWHLFYHSGPKGNSEIPAALGWLEEAVLGTALCPARTYGKHNLGPSLWGPVPSHSVWTALAFL